MVKNIIDLFLEIRVRLNEIEARLDAIEKPPVVFMDGENCGIERRSGGDRRE